MTRTIDTPAFFARLPRRHALRDAAVVAFLAIVLGAFVAQIVRPVPPIAQAHEVASAAW